MKNLKRLDFASSIEVNNSTRYRLTNRLITGSIIIILAISITLIWVADGKEYEAVDKIFGVIIPLVASWVGTILAFYFGRENLEAATNQVLALTRDTLDDIRVSNIMIHAKTIVAKKVSDEEESSLKLSEVLKLYKDIEKDRVPVLSLEEKPKYIVHISSMKDYVSSKPTGEQEALTLKNMMDDLTPRFRFEKNKGFVTVGQDMQLSQAIAKMNAVQNCQDIFVTEDGTPNTKVTGWLTNTLINRFLTV